MGSRSCGVGVAAFAAALAIVTIAASPAAARDVPSGGTSRIVGGALGADAIQAPEFREQEESEGEGVVNRARPGRKLFPKNALDAPVASSASVAANGAELQLGVNGLNFRDQRLANGGNQFSVEPLS